MQHNDLEGEYCKGFLSSVYSPGAPTSPPDMPGSYDAGPVSSGALIGPEGIGSADDRPSSGGLWRGPDEICPPSGIEDSGSLSGVEILSGILEEGSSGIAGVWGSLNPSSLGA